MVEAPGVESPDTPARSAAERRENPLAHATHDDAKQRKVSVSTPTTVDVVEAALANAIVKATAAGEWGIVAQLARELEARRTSRGGTDVVAIDRRARR